MGAHDEKGTVTERVQVGWMNPDTFVMCDCPVYETSPHAKSVPVYRERCAVDDPEVGAVTSDARRHPDCPYLAVNIAEGDGDQAEVWFCTKCGWTP